MFKVKNWKFHRTFLFFTALKEKYKRKRQSAQVKKTSKIQKSSLLYSKEISRHELRIYASIKKSTLTPFTTPARSQTSAQSGARDFMTLVGKFVYWPFSQIIFCGGKSQIRFLAAAVTSQCWSPLTTVYGPQTAKHWLCWLEVCLEPWKIKMWYSQSLNIFSRIIAIFHFTLARLTAHKMI